MKKLIAGILAGVVLATAGVVLAQNSRDTVDLIFRNFNPFIRYQGALSLQNAAGTAMAKATQAGFQIGASGTALSEIRRYSVSLVPLSVGGLTIAAQTLTVSGLQTGDLCVKATPPEQSGIAVVGCRVSTTLANSLVITFHNATGGAVTPTAATYDILGLRS